MQFRVEMKQNESHLETGQRFFAEPLLVIVLNDRHGAETPKCRVSVIPNDDRQT